VGARRQLRQLGDIRRDLPPFGLQKQELLLEDASG